MCPLFVECDVGDEYVDWGFMPFQAFYDSLMRFLNSVHSQKMVKLSTITTCLTSCRTF